MKAMTERVFSYQSSGAASLERVAVLSDRSMTLVSADGDAAREAREVAMLERSAAGSQVSGSDRELYRSPSPSAV